MKFVIIFLLLFSCTQKNKQVTVIKQWHLSPNQKTLDIEKSKSLPQFKNQKDIYLKTVNLIERGSTNVIIAEGCEGEINNNFKTVYNGWSLAALIKLANSDEFADIMAPVPLKIKAKFPKIRVICGDNLDLVDKNLRAISDLRGFSGFYQRLLESRDSNTEKYNLYKNQLISLFPKTKIIDPAQFTLKKSLEALEHFEGYIVQRNESFLAQAKKQIEDNPVIIIGGLHVQDLQQKFHTENLAANIITPLGYSNDEQKLIFALKEILNSGREQKIKFFQVPAGFDIEKFQVGHMIVENSMLTSHEAKDLREITKGKIDFKLILSDFDQDGVRDFTLSRGNNTIILSAEDTDWDNDGVDNLVDNDLGGKIIANVNSSIKVNNNFLSQANKDKITKTTNLYARLISNENISHELLVLEIFNKLIEKTSAKKHRIKFLMASKPKFSYGANVFFSYVKHTQVLEYYPLKLNNYINKQYQKRFYGVEFKKYINSYVIPLIIHSLAHEIGHSLDIDYLELAKINKWKWSKKKYTGKYLSNSRNSLKVIENVKNNLVYDKRDRTSWMNEYKVFSGEVNKILKTKDLTLQAKLIKNSSYKIKEAGKLIEHKLSFFYNKNLVSLYALKSPGEWFAESYATCVFKKLYPGSKKVLRAVELEHLLGFNPLATDDAFCSLF